LIFLNIVIRRIAQEKPSFFLWTVPSICWSWRLEFVPMLCVIVTNFDNGIVVRIRQFCLSATQTCIAGWSRLFHISFSITHCRPSTIKTCSSFVWFTFLINQALQLYLDCFLFLNFCCLFFALKYEINRILLFALVTVPLRIFDLLICFCELPFIFVCHVKEQGVLIFFGVRYLWRAITLLPNYYIATSVRSCTRFRTSYLILACLAKLLNFSKPVVFKCSQNGNLSIFHS
jgi:hypothetical protein